MPWIVVLVLGVGIGGFLLDIYIFCFLVFLLSPQGEDVTLSSLMDFVSIIVNYIFDTEKARYL